MGMDRGDRMMRGVAQGTVQAPPSKSATHRTFLLAAQADGPCIVERPLRAADTDATLDALRALGAQVDDQGDVVRFAPSDLQAPGGPIDCRNAGTALRLLAGTVARFDTPVTLDGDASLRRRPNTPLLDALETLGARIRSDDGCCPLHIQGPVHATQTTVPGDLSSQFTSSLLLSLPMLDGASAIHVIPPVRSRPYLDLTLDVAHRFGLRIQPEGDTFHVNGGDQPRGGHHRVEGDWSAAAFPLCAAALTHGRVTVEGLDPDSRQGDRCITDHLAAFGCKVTQEDDGVTVEGSDMVSPGLIDVADTPDMFPALAAVAACSQGATTFTGGAALRHKESDRIHAMATGLSALGIQADEHEDGLTVHGGTPTGGLVHAFDDHRIHMAFRVLALAADGDVQVDGADSAAISYPDFHIHMDALTQEDP